MFQEPTKNSIQKMRLVPKLTFWQPGGLPECPYFYRTILDFKWFSFRIHYWLASDDLRIAHDHPYWFITLVLWGGYFDLDFEGKLDYLHIGSIRFRKATHRHKVQLRKSPTITLLLTGPSTRRWGFWFGSKKLNRDKYFAEFGHHPCDESQEPIRMKPDGTRI